MKAAWLSLFTCLPFKILSPCQFAAYKMLKDLLKSCRECEIKIEEMEGEKGQRDQNEPRDTYKIAYIIHFLLGAGNLLPWNALITAVDYFGFLYPSKHVEKVFSVAYMGSSMVVLVVMMSWGGLSRKLSFRLRMNLGFIMFVLSIMVTPVLDWAWYCGETRARSNGAYGVTVGSVVICGLADGLIGGSLIGSAGNLPKQYMQAVFAGTASSGVLVSILRIITKASLPQTPQGLKTSAHFYFMVGTVILVCCIVCCNLLPMLPIMQYHHKLLRDHDHQISGPKFWDVAQKIRWPAFGIFMIYAVTLSIFPGYIAENLKSKVLGDWYPIMLVTMYNVSDFLGKTLTAIYVVKSVGMATWVCIARVVFYLLFTATLHGPDWLKSEAPMIFLTFALGLTNGYLTSVIMILTPKSVPASEAEVSAMVMAVSLGMGLVSGSVLGWFWII